MAFSFTTSAITKKKRTGFTLIELIITIAIIGILALLGMRGYMEGIKRAKVSRAQADLNRIAKAIRQLELDTGRTGVYKEFNPVTGCTTEGLDDEFEILKSNDNVGIYRQTVAAGTFSNWKGPYLDEQLLDPWGRPYVYDADYYCARNAETKKAKGCEDYINKAVSDHQQVVYSRGPNGNVDTGIVNAPAYDSDNIVLVLCTE